MNLPWFKRIGIFFLPAKFIGWIILIVGIACAVYIFIDIDSRSHSASDTLRNFFFKLFLIFVVYSIIGFVTSHKKKK